ncbi:MAG TPA: DNA-processing protein DprA [Candidatus Lachnoclostridium pullistercoris]|uniref:DNA-processing protein DprA n=1 Tax=Candidatus Lachnoclostridium pullistercoris TaxID=2838632 RepID=A0A9D2PF08_9FIRM|nr:DNA-processing protein DprA [Candidatus Lachnoclostridium pullistercoris]
MTEKEREYLYLLCRTRGLGAVTIRKLWEEFESFEAVYYIEETGQGKKFPALGRAAEKIAGTRKEQEKLLDQYHRFSDLGIQFITPFDRAYPEKLKEIYDFPMGLCVKGRLPEPGSPAAAVVGARENTEYGRGVAEWYGRELAKAGVWVVSGLARGTDSWAHKGALAGGGRTAAVLGNGTEVCYPPEHCGLYREIEENGCLISEFGPWDRPAPGNFPMRNRIISGMADAVVVVEARERSGSLITAALALDQGREVLAVPGRQTDPLSAGCNHLIKSGAQLTDGPGDVLEILQIKNRKMTALQEKNGKGLAKKEKMVYSCLDLQPKFLDEIAGRCGLPVGECMGILLELEWKGYVVRTANQYYGKKL